MSIACSRIEPMFDSKGESSHPGFIGPALLKDPLHPAPEFLELESRAVASTCGFIHFTKGIRTEASSLGREGGPGE